jgi:tetratricopeptide (TPR) repeat protein
VEGVEPVKEEGREWAKEIALAIPFIGSLASIGSAITAVGRKVSPKLKGKYSTVGKWLQDQLGKNHVEQLLQILWKKPRDAEFLFLDALLEDIKNRKDTSRAILFLMDHFEYVDSEKTHWRYAGKQISEHQLWRVFLCSLSNCVGVMASRKTIEEQAKEEVEESELIELDRDSCIELLEQRRIIDKELQDKMVSVSGGNPFVIGAMCDLAESGGLSPNDVEDLRADTLDAVRLKTWRRLFSRVQDLLNLVEKAGLVPFFNRRILAIVAPDMRADHWDRMTRLSFVRDRGDGTWVLHDLARDLIIAELGQRLYASTDEIATTLEEASNEVSDYTLLGLSISVRALDSEIDAEARVGSIVTDLFWKNAFSDALALLDAVAINTREGHAIVQGLRGCVLISLNRFADGEHSLLSALETFEEYEEETSDELMIHKAQTLRDYGILLFRTQRTSDAIEILQQSAKLYQEINENTPGFRLENVGRVYWWLGFAMTGTHRLKGGEEAFRKAYELAKKSKPTASYIPARFILTSLRGIGLAQGLAGKITESEETFREGLEISRELVKERREFKVVMAMYLSDLGDVMRLTSRPSEAINLCQDAVQLLREVIKEKQGGYSHSLILGLNNLAKPLWQIGKYEEAAEKYQEALSLSRDHAEKTPDAFLPFLAWTLHDYAVLLRLTDKTSEAEEACGEALRIHKELVAVSPGRHQRVAAWNLNNMAVILRETGRMSQADEYYREALGYARELALQAPECVFISDLLATILNNLAVFYRQTGKQPEAKKTLEEALEIRRRLAQKSPELFLCRIATSLNNQGVLLFETNNVSEAEKAFQEALQLRRELFDKSPDQYRTSIVSTLNNLGILFKRTGRSQESQNAYREVTSIAEDMVSKVPVTETEEWSEEEELEANPAGVT